MGTVTMELLTAKKDERLGGGSYSSSFSFLVLEVFFSEKPVFIGPDKGSTLWAREKGSPRAYA